MSGLDAGQGRGVLIKSPRGKVLIIDTRPCAGYWPELGAALPMWRKNIDAVILTDTARTASGGLADVFARYGVALFARPRTRGTASQEASIAAAVAGATGVQEIAGTVSLSTGDGVVVEPLLSAVRVSYGSTAFLITNAPPTGLSGAEVVISPTTLAGTYVSNGTAVRDGG